VTQPFEDGQAIVAFQLTQLDFGTTLDPCQDYLRKSGCPHSNSASASHSGFGSQSRGSHFAGCWLAYESFLGGGAVADQRFLFDQHYMLLAIFFIPSGVLMCCTAIAKLFAQRHTPATEQNQQLRNI
jgi:hypothetical protein